MKTYVIRKGTPIARFSTNNRAMKKKYIVPVGTRVWVYNDNEPDEKNIVTEKTVTYFAEELLRETASTYIFKLPSNDRMVSRLQVVKDWVIIE